MYYFSGRLLDDCDSISKCLYQATAVLDCSRTGTDSICGSRGWALGVFGRPLYRSDNETGDSHTGDHVVPLSEPVRACWYQTLSEGYNRKVTARICGSNKEWEGFHSFMDRKSEIECHELHDMLPRLRRISASLKRWIESSWMRIYAISMFVLATWILFYLQCSDLDDDDYCEIKIGEY